MNNKYYTPRTAVYFAVKKSTFPGVFSGKVGKGLDLVLLPGYASGVKPGVSVGTPVGIAVGTSVGTVVGVSVEVSVEISVGVSLGSGVCV